MPNKTIYVSDDDLVLYRRAQELAGGNLSAAIATALRRYVEIEEGRIEGYDEIVVRVGTGVGRKVRFSGVLLGEVGQSTKTRMEEYRVYRSRTGKFAVHMSRSEEWTDEFAEEGQAWNWRRMFASEQSWTRTPAESTLDVFDTLEELRGTVPDRLYDIVASLADQPAVEDLDI